MSVFYESITRNRTLCFCFLDQNIAGGNSDSMYDDAGSYDSELYDDVSFNIDQAFDDESADEDYHLNEDFLHDYIALSKCNIDSHTKSEKNY